MLAVKSSAASAGYVRPFGDNAPWNVPVSYLPRHPNGEVYVRRLWEDGSDRVGNINLSFNEYTYPVYDARDATMTVRVNLLSDSPLNGNRLPWNPAWRAAPGSDAQVILLDTEKGIEWDLWQVRIDGAELFATNGSQVDGDYRTMEGGNRPSRGVGVPYLAMLVRPEEIAAGKIDHALSLAVRNTDGAYAVPPATKLEFPDRIYNGIPTGMRFALDISDDGIEQWIRTLPASLSDATLRSAKIIAEALRDYGWFITDTSGSAHLQFESRVSAGQKWDVLGLGPKLADDGLPRDLLDGLLNPDRIYVVVPSDQYPKEWLARGVYE